MARTNTVLDLPDSPRWDPETNSRTRRKKLRDENGDPVRDDDGNFVYERDDDGNFVMEPVPVRDPFTDEQKERAKTLAKELVERVDAEASAIEQIEDPDQLIERAHFEMQVIAVLYNRLSELRDSTIADVLNDPETPPDKSAEYADRLFISESRLRQIKARDTLNNDEPSHQAKVAEMMSEDLLRELYEDQLLSTRKIAERLGVNTSTVVRYMDKYDIERRDPLDPRYLAQRGKNRREKAS